MKLARLKSAIAFLFLCSRLFAGDWILEHSPLLPETGAVARTQGFIDLQGGSHVLSIAVAPGFEDMSALSYLRFHLGTVVSTVYITNGEEIANDFGNESFQQTAIRRKEEAVNAMRMLGGDAYFLNVPADQFWRCGIENNFTDIESNFAGSLQKILTTVKPDIIIISYDHGFNDSHRSRTSFIRERVLEVLKADKKNKLFPAPRVIIQIKDPSSLHFPVRSIDKPRKKNYRDLADEIDKTYQSLHNHITSWRNGLTTGYNLVYPPSQKGLRVSDFRSPVRSPEVSRLHADVMRVIERNSVENIAKAVDLVDAYIFSHSKNMDALDQRNIVDIKKRLERYRCALLDISIPFSVDFHYVTPIQVFFLRLGAMPQWAHSGENLVMFPQAQGNDWIVNEKHFQYYSFMSDTAFRIVTSRTMSLTDPATREGFVADQVYFPFTVMVIHKDKDKARNFIFECEIPLIVTLRQTLEVLTPIISSKIDKKIIVRITNNTHDKVRSALFIGDSVVNSPELMNYLEHKRDQAIDTFHLQWQDSPVINDHNIVVKLKSGMLVASVFSKALKVEAPDIHIAVGIISQKEDNALQEAFSGLHIPYTDLDAANCTEEVLKGYSTIFLDAFSYNLLYSAPTNQRGLLQWVRNGGKLVMLPQDPALSLLDDSIHFNFNEPVVTMNDSDIIAEDKLITSPNNIFNEEWKEWLFAYANCTIDVQDADMKSKVLLKSKAGDQPVMVKRSYGRGSIIYCGLNIKMQLSNYRNIAFKLLVNMIWN